MKAKTLFFAVVLGGAALARAASSPFAWGVNSYGNLGDGTTTDRSTPVAVYTSGVLSGKTVTAIAAGTSHTIAVTSDGKVYAWGANAHGQIGDGTTTSHSTAVAVDMTGALLGKTASAVAAGGFCSYVLTTDGLVFAWGQNANGELGDGSTTNRSTPVAVDTSGVLAGKVITSIACGLHGAVVLTADNLLFTWGRGTSGQLGNGTTTDSSLPVAVDVSGVLAGKTFSRLGAGQSYFLVTATDGRIYGWGNNTYSQLGDGTTTDRATPVAVDASGVLATKTMVYAGGASAHTVALSSDGMLYSWGYNGSSGLLGDGTTTDSSTPVVVDMTGALAGKIVSNISVCGGKTLALTTDGELYTWGGNANGDLGDGTSIDRLTAVAVDMTGALAGMSVTVISNAVHTSAVLASPSVSTITPANRFTYAANFGWLNWRTNPLALDAPVIETTMLHGRVYSANVGWIDLGDGSPSTTSGYSQTGGDIGVNHDGAGNLSGYAYGANIGWIYFDPTIAAPPRVSLTTGAMSGYAYSANCGWIHLGGLSTRLHPGADLDTLAGGGTGDGIADSWEVERAAAAGFGSNLGLLGSSPTSDFDGDGLSDLDEYRADTNPFSANSRFTVTGFQYDSNTGNIDLDWTGSARRSFTIWCSSDLQTWTQVGSTQTGGSAALSLGGPSASHLFFRVQADVPLVP